MNEFEAHESSYDHQHKKRLKEMKQMQRDPLASTKARKAERKADEKSGLITIKPLSLSGPPAGAGGFKKGGFKSAFGGPKKEADPAVPVGVVTKVVVGDKAEALESDTEDEGYEMYDPRNPTD
ncbi:MAG: hypothetical protein M1829_004304 [Trizodia sp. TS-e1964]|nr:MAG: hypothetical protein M1829_004304 [Trizodia sp. TS-e1964]